MGACVSSSSDDTEQKKRSQQIDRELEEDAKRLRRECKILLLGKFVWAGGPGRSAAPYVNIG
jgi:hypothetical protein